MKKLIIGVVVIFIGSMFFTSCSSDSTVMSQFSKRKYMKNFKKSKFKQKEIIDEYQYAETTTETENRTAKTANFVLEELVEDDNSEMVEFVINEKNENTLSTKKEALKISNTASNYSSWKSYNRNADMAEAVTFYNTKSNTKNSKLNSNRVDDVVLIILGIFIPCLAVYLYEDTVTTNFWVALILQVTVFLWIVAIVFAFLVMFGGVSL